MHPFLRKVLANIPSVVRRPGRAARLFFRRVLPFAAIMSDAEAYQIVGTWTFGRLPRTPAGEVFPGIERADATMVRVLDRRPDVSASVLEVAILAAVVRQRSPRRLLEIGTSDGNTTMNLAANAPTDAVVTTVDLPPDFQGGLALAIAGGMHNVTERSRLGVQFKDSPYAAKIVQIFGDSAALDWSRFGGPFDLIFIDGCHDYEYVVADTRHALQQIRPGGLIVWHDYGMIEDVSRAVDEIAGRVRVVAIRSTSLAVAFVA